jgi:hypothetical protein
VTNPPVIILANYPPETVFHNVALKSSIAIQSLLARLEVIEIPENHRLDVPWLEHHLIPAPDPTDVEPSTGETLISSRSLATTTSVRMNEQTSQAKPLLPSGIPLQTAPSVETSMSTASATYIQATNCQKSQNEPIDIRLLARVNFLI